jgi:rubrerythrin
LKNAKDAAATEALEIATYTALERLATDLGDERTARLAREIRADEERMLDRILTEIPQLTGKVTAADVRGNPSYDIAKTGAGEAVRSAADAAKEATANAGDSMKATARSARKVPGVARAEGAVKGAVASADDLAINGYDHLNANQIVVRLPQLSQVDLAKIAVYEGKGQNRSTITDRIESLTGDEPWPGYDELTVPEIRKALANRDDDRVREALSYERRHKNRAGVLQAAETSATTA